jgi:GT2 family glycosyltransferase
VVFAQADTLLAPAAQFIIKAQIADRPDVEIFYADDAALGEAGLDRRLRLKPSFDPALLIATDYIGAPLIVRAAALERLGGLRPAAGEAGLYDLVLRASRLGMPIGRIPHVLIAYPDKRPAISTASRRQPAQAWAASRNGDVVEGLGPDLLRLQKRFDAHPAVTLVVPTRQSRKAGAGRGRPLILDLLDSLARTDWPMDRLHVLIGDDHPDLSIYQGEARPFQLRVVPTPRPPGEPFNYAAKMNTLWRQAQTEHLVFMNDDVEVTSPGWLKALLTFSTDPQVGGVGARLLYPDGRLQHAGVIGGLFGACAHAWLNQPADQPTYQDWAIVHKAWSIVTGAVFATRRAAMEAVNGFDERFSLEFNDVDLCLRLGLAGLSIVYTPHAELKHEEKASREEARPPGPDVALFLDRWRGWLADDPCYHPRLTRDGFVPHVQPRDDDWFSPKRSRAPAVG